VISTYYYHKKNNNIGTSKILPQNMMLFIGSLIAFFKARQGASFYVKIYCAFYLPGLPISLLQQRYDEALEEKFGTAKSYMFRVVGAQGMKIIALFFMPFVPRMVSEDAIPNVMLMFMVLIGIFSWSSHGTACQVTLSSLYMKLVVGCTYI
jgi:hypothetical protein